MIRSLTMLALSTMFLPLPVNAQAAKQASWGGCTIDFAQNTLDLGNLRLDVPAEKLGRNAPLMAYIIAKEGPAAAGIKVHEVYARCTEPLASKGIPTDEAEKLASECAAGAVIRWAALLRMRSDVTLEQLKEGAPPEGRQAVEFLYKTAQNYSFTKAVFASLESGLACIDAAQRKLSRQ